MTEPASLAHPHPNRTDGASVPSDAMPLLPNEANAGPFDGFAARTERDAFRLDALLGHLDEARHSQEPIPPVGRSLALIFNLAQDAIVPRMDAAAGRAAARLLTEIRGPLRTACAGRIDEADLEAGITAAIALVRYFGRSWQDIQHVNATELTLDRIRNVAILANLLMNDGMRAASADAGNPHRRSMTLTVAAGGQGHV